MDPNPPPTTPVAVQLRTPFGQIDGKIDVPDRPYRLAELALAAQDLAQAAADLSGQVAEKAAGEKISCCAGCGACCRHLVPLSPPEALLIVEMVDSMSEPRRGAIRKRFRIVHDFLEKKEMLEPLGELMRVEADEERSMQIARDYFELHISCPFLERESCSIYDYRPARCREYMVTSPAENCADPYGNPIDVVPLPAKVSEALARLSAELLHEEPHFIPLSLALSWAAEQGQTGTLGSDGAAMVNALMDYLNEGDKIVKKGPVAGDTMPTGATGPGGEPAAGAED